MAPESQDEGDVQLLVVPEGKLEEARRAIRRLFDDDDIDNGDVGPEPDPVFVPDTSSATGCRRTAHHDIHCSDDT
ncbi:MAG: hypothetical protein ABS81_14120 [Pseudonocardia sp. SCN 72-86]|nr:MAG: hypothetical protein ABS81_14120 [Pseudonocardia sp. SCN 72-86]